MSASWDRHRELGGFADHSQYMLAEFHAGVSAKPVIDA